MVENVYWWNMDTLRMGGYTLGATTCLTAVIAALGLFLVASRTQSFMSGLRFGANGLFFPLMLPACIAASFVALTWSTIDFMNTSTVTNGQVVALEENTHEGSVTYSAIVAYKVPDGRVIQFDDPSKSCNPPCNQVGDEVRIRYRISNPNHAQIESPILNWTWAGVTGLLTVVFFGVALFYSVKAYKREEWDADPRNWE